MIRTSRSHKANKRAKQYGAKGKWSFRTVANLYVKQRGKCAICAVRLFGKYEVDHIKPLSKGGSNEPNNLQLLCPKCNRVKGSKYDENLFKV